MAQDITIAGASYADVPAVDVAKTGGGTARFVDTSDANATNADILNNKTAYVDGIKIVGTGTSGAELSIIVTVDSGSVVTATKGALSVSGTSVNGSCTLVVPEEGIWSVGATLSGQTSDVKSVNVVDSYAVALTFFSATITVNVATGASVVLTKGSSTQTKTSSGGVATFTVTETGTYSVSATLSGQTVTGSVNVVSGTTSYSIALTLVSSTLNNNDWDVISQVSDDGDGANYWSIGDRKAVTLSGTVGAITLSSFSTYAFIIGFNHNSTREGNGIHFQGFKTAQTGGVDIALCDSYYNTNGEANKCFSMNHSTSNTNANGWKGCDLRYDILGSVHAKNTQNAATTTATSPVAASLMAALPSDLRAQMQPMTKYTDNTGGGSDTASYVTATTDYLPLLAEFEVFGNRTYANSAEKNYQAQYQYYINGNSKIKYRHDSTGTAVYWWERSPRSSTSTGFCYVNSHGIANYTTSRYAYGLAPAFKI